MPIAASKKSLQVRNAEGILKKRAEARNIKIPKCKNPARRKACENDPVKFATTYFSEPPDAKKFPGKTGMISAALAPIHIELYRHLQERILYGGLEAFVAPRGFGKDTIAKIMAMWGTFYGHTRFVVYACYEDSKSDDAIDSIKEQIEINTLLAEDFPEVCYPARALNRAPQRAKLQTFKNEHTRIEWSGTIVLPSVKGMPCSGNIIAPGSMGASIRGLNVNGERPSFVICSDPQTRLTAKSKDQCDQIVAKLNGDIGGLGSHVEPMACLALMTVISVGDVADQLTNPDLNPQWNGKRLKAMTTMPKNMELWEKYFDLMTAEARKKKEKDSTYREANEFYLKNRDALDEGADAAWPDGFIKKLTRDGSPLESSAIQHMMNWLWTHKEEAFMAECQGEPIDKDVNSGITPEIVCSRLNTMPQNVAPRGRESMLVQGIDIRAGEIHYVVLACGEDSSKSIIDFGIIAYKRPSASLAGASDAVQLAMKKAILDALRVRGNEMKFKPYLDTYGNKLTVALTLVDMNWMKEPVYIFTKEGGSRWRPTRGDTNRPGARRFHMPKKSKTELPGDHFYSSWQPEDRVWLWGLDADYWKLEVHDGFVQDPLTPGAIDIFGTDPRDKTLMKFANHICAERWNLEKNKFDKRSPWNHWLDCLAMALSAASMMGVSLLRHEMPKVQARSVNLSDYFGKKRSREERAFAA